MVSRDEIRGNDYNLNIPRYVDSSEASESWDIYASMFGGIPKKEINEIDDYWQAFPSLKLDLFTNDLGEHVELVEGNIKEMIKNHPDAILFKQQFIDSFEGFDSLLYDHLIKGMQSLNISKEESLLSNEIFKRLEKIPLIDEYKAYQLLNDEWVTISVDLEMIQSEGFNATKQVDPNMVTKKNNGKDDEIQDGWRGRIIPFELVQENLLRTQTISLKEKENRLAQVSAEYQEIMELLTEEEKDDLSGLLNDDKTAFLTSPLTKFVKELQINQKTLEYQEDSLERKLISVMDLIDEEKQLKSLIKTSSAELHLLTKEIIEMLSDEQVYDLLRIKWIVPLIKELYQLPNIILDQLASKVQSLAEKYEDTFSDVEDEIIETESKLTALIEKLTGNKVDMLGLSEFKKILGGK